MLIDLATKVAPAIEVVFFDTEAHFPETLAFVEEMRERYGLNLTVTKPGPEAAAHPCGSDAVLPVPQGRAAPAALAGKRAWLTSLKRSDGPTRADAPIVSWDAGFGLVKVNPLATWTEDDISSYLADHGLPVHPLIPRGYRSIGCAPTTRPVAEGEDARAGRWAGARQVRVRPARLVPRDLDNPYGMEFRGRRDRGLEVRPALPQHRRAQPRRAAEAGAPPLRGRPGGHRHLRQAGRRLHQQGARRGRSGSSGSACTRSARAATPS